VRTIVWGLQLSELLLVAVTTVYTVLTAVLATQAWRQRRAVPEGEVAVVVCDRTSRQLWGPSPRPSPTT
jgi:hypothetical protein